MNLFEMEKHHTKTLWLLALLLTFSTVVWGRIGHSPELKTSLDKLLRRKRGILIQNIVDFVLMDRAEI